MPSIARRSLNCCLLLSLIFSLLIDSRAQESPSAPIQIPAAKLNSYVGQYLYDDNPYLPLSVTVTAGKLYVESARAPHQELVPSSQDNTFVPLSNPNPVIFKFTVDADGKVTGLTRIAADKSSRHAKKISDQPQSFNKPVFSRREVMIPVRDGIKLHAIILTPTDASEALPILLERTPYGVDNANSDSVNARYSELVKDRYIFVFQDIRGRYKSEGTFVMARADGRPSKS